MDIRYSCNQRDFKHYTTDEARKELLIESLFRPDAISAVYSHIDRVVVLGCMPVSESVPIDKGMDVWASFGADYFLERREAGVFNIGGSGTIRVDGRAYETGYKDCSYYPRSPRSNI